MLPLLLTETPAAMSSDVASATTAASIDASSELRYTGFVVGVVVSRNIDLAAEAGNSKAALTAAAAASAWHSGLLKNDLEPPTE